MTANQVEARRREGYLNRYLHLEVARIGADVVLLATVDVLHLGRSLGLRPADEPTDVDAFQPNDAVRARFSRLDDATYAFSSRVLEVDGREGLLWIASPVNIERIQARRHVRVSTGIAGEIAAAGPRRVNDTDDTGGFKSVVVTDISAGGVSIRSGEVLEKGITMLVNARVPDRKGLISLNARAHVVRSVIDSGPGEETCYRYGLEYIDLGSKQEAQLVASIFWQMSQNRVV